MNFGDFLNNLAAKIGAQNDPNLVDLLSSAELSQHEINDDLASRFDTGLMSLEGAKNNREVLNHLKPIILKSADDKFAVFAEKYGFGDEMQGEQSTYKKIDLFESKLAAKLAELEQKARSAGGQQGEKVTELTKQIENLQKQLQTITAAKESEIAALRKSTEQQQLEMLVNFELNGKRYANQDLGETNVEVARSLITKALAERKALLVNENGKLRLMQAENPSLEYVDSGYKPVTFSDFANQVLADKHLLEVSNNPEPGGGAYFQPQQPSIQIPGSGKGVDTSSIDAAAAASLADLT